MPEPALQLIIKDPGKLGRKLADLSSGPLANVIGQASAHAKKTAAQGVGGTAARSIMSEVTPISGRVFSMMSPARTTSIELGRSAGGPLIHPDALVRWIRRVGYPDNAFVLAREIRRRGVKGRFFMQGAIRSTQAVLPTLLSGAARQIESTFTSRR